MRFIAQVMLVCGVVSLAGCATNSHNAERGLQATMGQPLIQNSIMREGDALTFQVAVPQSINTVPVTGMFEAACSSPTLYFLYVHGTQRAYPAGSVNYSAARQLSPTLYPSLAANPTFTQACAQTPKPDWRVVKTNDREDWTLLDRNSVKTVNGEVRFWAAFDSPTVLTDMPYDAPYAQKREQFAVSCAAGTYKMLAGYDLDANNRVTDGRVTASPAAEQIVGSNADYQALFALACGNAEKAAALDTFKPRQKAPLVIKLEAVQPSVLNAIKQLDLGQPRQTLNYVRTQGTTNFEGKSGTASEERFISTDKSSGQLSINSRAEGYDNQQVSWRGLLPLVSKTNFTVNGASDSRSTSQLSFSGNWKTLPVGETVSHTSTQTTVSSLVGKYGGKPQTTHCKVERELNASELNAALSGTAKALSCSTEGDEYKRVNHVYYLNDYGYFFQASTDKNRFYYSDYRIESVK